MVGARLACARTCSVKPGSEVVAMPSVTEMMMLDVLPTLDEVGVPESRPVEVLNVAQLGRFWIENCSELPSGSLATGVKLYALPAVTLVAGVPVMVGARFVGGVVGALTVMLKAGSEVVAMPSFTEITMPLAVPTFAAAGMPEMRPVDAVKVSQAGRFCTV